MTTEERRIEIRRASLKVQRAKMAIGRNCMARGYGGLKDYHSHDDDSCALLRAARTAEQEWRDLGGSYHMKG